MILKNIVLCCSQIWVDIGMSAKAKIGDSVAEHKVFRLMVSPPGVHFVSHFIYPLYK